MGARVPTLLWFGRDDERLGVLRPVGAVVHREEVGGEDVIEFACRTVPTKYDRIVWRDPEDARWREHVVIRTDEAAGGVCEVYAESSLCDLLAGYIEEERLSSASVVEALQTVLSGTRWSFTAEPGFGAGGCVLYHANRLAALRRVCEVWGCEVEAEITVMFGGVTLRTLHARERVGAWRGARLTYAKNMTGCVRTVCEDEVVTALFGYGAGLLVVDSSRDPAWRFRSRVMGRVRSFGDEVSARLSIGRARTCPPSRRRRT